MFWYALKMTVLVGMGLIIIHMIGNHFAEKAVVDRGGRIVEIGETRYGADQIYI